MTKSFALSLGACLLLPLLAGCDHYIAQRFVRAPNLELSVRGHDAPSDELRRHRVAHQLRVSVGPPPATISVWVVSSISQPAYLSLRPGATPFDDPVASLKLLPQTRPSDSPPADKGTIFLLHGLEDTKADVAFEFYSFALACQGYRVVLVDLRGHGRSTGDHISYGAYEAHDLKQVLDELERQNLVAGRVGALGISYGASVAICWSAVDPRVKAVVALEPFSSLRYAAADAGREMLAGIDWLLSARDYQEIDRQIEGILGVDSDESSPLNAISHCSTPVLLIHGKADHFLYPIHSIRLHEAAPDHSQLILVEGANHFDLWYRSVNLILAESNRWFEKYLDDGRSPIQDEARLMISLPPIR